MRSLAQHSLSRLVIIALVLSLVLAGCGGNSGNTNSNAENNNAGNTNAGNNNSASGNDTGSEGYVVKHAMGETPIPKTPERVVILTNEGTEALLALGVKPVGAVKSWLGDPWYDHIKEQMEGVVNVGTESEPDIEKILELKPDLIIGNKMRLEAKYEQLSAIAPTVFSEDLRGNWKNNFSLYAEALNRKADGEKVLNNYDQRIEDFHSKAGDKLDTEVSIVRFMSGLVRIYYKDTFSGIILDQIGFKRPATQDKQEFAAEVTKERIPEMEGDILFYFTYETGNGDASKVEEEWLNDPLWNNLEVVKNNKAFKVSDPIWNTAGGVLAANLMLDDLYEFFEIEK